MVATSSTIHYQQVLQLKTQGKSLGRFTRKVQEIVAASGVKTGLCSIFLRHTSASLVIQENADPDVLRDMETFLAKLVPEGNYYRHSDEGPDDMPAHIHGSLSAPATPRGGAPPLIGLCLLSRTVR